MVWKNIWCSISYFFVTFKFEFWAKIILRVFKVDCNYFGCWIILYAAFHSFILLYSSTAGSTFCMCQENVTVTSTMFILEQYCTLGYMAISQLWDLSVLLIKHLQVFTACSPFCYHLCQIFWYYISCKDWNVVLLYFFLLGSASTRWLIFHIF